MNESTEEEEHFFALCFAFSEKMPTYSSMPLKAREPVCNHEGAKKAETSKTTKADLWTK